jgi:hypothetical protein
MIFRRPELEKDNPVAPQPYIGPRRRLAMARAAASGKTTEVEDVRDTLKTLVEAATYFVRSRPKAKKTDEELGMLQKAIAQAQRALNTQDPS